LLSIRCCSLWYWHQRVDERHGNSPPR